VPIQGTPSISSASTLTLTAAASIYVYNGATTATWTLPAISGNTGELLVLYNRGTATVTVSCSGADNLYSGGATQTSIALPPGGSIQVLNDGVYWLVVSGDLSMPKYDNSAISSQQSSLSSGTAFTFTQTVATGNPYGVIIVDALEDGNMDFGATPVVSLGGVSLSSLGHVYANNASTGAWLWVFGAPNIPSGTQTASVKLTQTGKTFYGYAASATYLNVTDVAALFTAYGSSGPTPSTTFTTPTLQPNVMVGAWAGKSLTNLTFTERRSGNFSTLGKYFITGDMQVFNTATLKPSVFTDNYGNTTEWAFAGLGLS
jgi:hypothetical protein